LPSWQSRIGSLLIRTLVKRRPKEEEREVVRQLRSWLDDSRFVRRSLPVGLTARPSNVMGVRGEWLDWTDQTVSRTLVYFHGGGYIACSPLTHRPITVALTRLLRTRTFVPEYRLAPEHRFPAAVEDALRAYRGLLARQVDPREIVMAGDSAGGGLLLGTLVALRDAGEPLPAAAACFSPWTDLAATSSSLDYNDRRDTMFYGESIRRAALVYLGNASPRDPLASPVYADLTGLPPIVVHASRSEVLLDDSIRLASRARECGVEVELEVWNGLPHAWQMLVGLVPEAEQSLQRVASFLDSHLPFLSTRSAQDTLAVNRHFRIFG